MDTTPTSAPAGDVAPVAPAAPAAPVVAPVTPPAGNDAADSAEWDSATDEIFPGIKTSKEEKKKNGPAEPTKEPEAPKAPGTEGEGATGDDDGDEEEVTPPDTTARDARLAAREFTKQVDEVKDDVRKQMFADQPTELRDADGDPIRTIEDVMKLINPRTGEPFTETDAGVWLLAAQQQFNKNVAESERQLDQIAELNVDLKDQADSVLYRYGELFKLMPELRQKVWAQFEKTLQKDAKSGIITKTSIPLDEFYDLALQPYVELANKAEAAEATKVAEDTQAEVAARRQQTRADRSDIYAPNNKPQVDDETREWDEATNAVFGDQLKNRK